MAAPVGDGRPYLTVQADNGLHVRGADHPPFIGFAGLLRVVRMDGDCTGAVLNCPELWE